MQRHRAYQGWEMDMTGTQERVLCEDGHDGGSVHSLFELGPDLAIRLAVLRREPEGHLLRPTRS